MKRGPGSFAAPRAPRLFLSAVAVSALALVAAGCSKEEAPSVVAKPAPTGAAPAAPAAPKPKGPTPVNEADLPKIPIEPGYKYYIGGPHLDKDKYGKHRIQSFNDEVAQPPSRGMVFGVKRDGDKVEYKVWANGRYVALNRGRMVDGLFWKDYYEGFKKEVLVTRETYTHDDEKKVTRIVTEEFDYETGEPIRTKEMEMSYFPAEEDDEEDEEDAGTAKPAAGTPAAPAAPPKAPAAPAAPPAP